MKLFFLLNAKTKTEGGESYLQFGASIKMQIVGNHFSAVTMEALSLQHPKTVRRMDPPKPTTPEFFIFKLKHSDSRKGIYFILQVMLFVKMISPISLSLCHGSDKSRCCTDLLVGVSGLHQEQAKVCQSISYTQDVLEERNLEGQACCKHHPARTFNQ